jgi:hypothetical protein
MDKVKEFYYSLWNSSSSLVELAIHRCLPGDWGVTSDGEWYQQVPGGVLIDQGKKGVSPDSWYLSHAQSKHNHWRVKASVDDGEWRALSDPVASPELFEHMTDIIKVKFLGEN